MSRLRLVPGDTGRGIMDGGWWPRSRDAAAELTELVIALTERLGMATRLTIDFDDWQHVPLRITAPGRVIRVGWAMFRLRRSWPPATSPSPAPEPHDSVPLTLLPGSPEGAR
ncbi:hypothetical protein GCM10009527_091280 [Actinomadura nitritigenes]|uniref:Uncharacterized protein n=1 Tax=Actinomadura nitritigenes TaxID=134602 RepID=A0ABS3RDL3_9ACTN|nr:DUF5994 family protein [Actinomadura nitritigenes]MBO2443694.1 hypothetical protein [Actinomadura nitritigenes]